VPQLACAQIGVCVIKIKHLLLAAHRESLFMIPQKQER
jgi:hypothetical protein